MTHSPTHRILPRGPVTTAQLAAAGVSRAAQQEHYRRLWNGMYRRADQPDGLALRTRALAAHCPDGVLCGRSAAWAWGDDSAPPSTLPEVLVPYTRRQTAGFRYHFGSIAPSGVRTVDGLTVTSPERTVRDLVRTLPADEAVVAIERMAAADPELPARLAAFADHPSRPGPRALAEVLGRVCPGSPGAGLSRVRLLVGARPHVARLDGREVYLHAALPELATAIDVADLRGTLTLPRPALRRAGWRVLVVRTTAWGGPVRTPPPAPAGDPVVAALEAAGHRVDIALPTHAGHTEAHSYRMVS